MSADLEDGHAVHAHFYEGVLECLETRRLNDGFDFGHGLLLSCFPEGYNRAAGCDECPAHEYRGRRRLLKAHFRRSARKALGLARQERRLRTARCLKRGAFPAESRSLRRLQKMRPAITRSACPAWWRAVG